MGTLPALEETAQISGNNKKCRVEGSSPTILKIKRPNRFEERDFTPRKICSFWRQDPSMCDKGDTCNFAHGVHELDPESAEKETIDRFHHTGFLPKQMSRYFENGGCDKGFGCTFAHNPRELKG